MTKNDGGKVMTAEEVYFHFVESDENRLTSYAVRASCLEQRLGITLQYDGNCYKQDTKLLCPQKKCPASFAKPSDLEDHLRIRHELALSRMSQRTCHSCLYGQIHSTRALIDHERYYHDMFYPTRFHLYLPYLRQYFGKPNKHSYGM
jgi:hypothetical protein